MLALSLSLPALYQLRVVLCGVSPLIWRRLLVSSETSLAELHEVLQIVFNWSGEHLHRFRIHGRDYGVLQVGGMAFEEDARRVPLSRFRLHTGERFRYEYDFTADWKVDIRLEQTLPGDAKRALPWCLGGRRTAPVEGCAGAWDYLEQLDQHRCPVEDLAVLAEAMQRLLDTHGDRQGERKFSGADWLFPHAAFERGACRNAGYHCRNVFSSSSLSTFVRVCSSR